MPSYFKLEPPVYRGDTCSWVVEVYTINGDPMDLTSATLKGEIRQGSAQPVKGVFTFIKDPVKKHVFTMTIAAAASKFLPAGSGLHYDIEATWVDGRVTTLLAGEAPVIGDITNSD